MANSTVAVRNTTTVGRPARRSPVRQGRDLIVTHPTQVIVAAILVATVARLTYGTLIGHRVLGPDESTYASAAHDLAQHGLFSSAVHGLPFWSPGYPMLLGAINVVFGDATFPVTVFQAGIIGVTTWLTYRLGLRVVGSRAALLAALLMSVSLVWGGRAPPRM
jgi:4-amino-4-deoxy-L-arabinose transferase-like glycosyltransferase